MLFSKRHVFLQKANVIKASQLTFSDSPHFHKGVRTGLKSS